jgi:nicotinic acid mononucleotide adenylyltransferase
VKLFVYPTLDRDSGDLITAHDFKMSSKLDILYRYLLEEGRIEAIETFDSEHLAIRSRDVRHKLRIGDASWEDMVPSRVAQMIKTKKLFGYKPAP